MSMTYKRLKHTHTKELILKNRPEFPGPSFGCMLKTPKILVKVMNI